MRNGWHVVDIQDNKLGSELEINNDVGGYTFVCTMSKRNAWEARWSQAQKHQEIEMQLGIRWKGRCKLMLEITTDNTNRKVPYIS